MWNAVFFSLYFFYVYFFYVSVQDFGQEFCAKIIQCCRCWNSRQIKSLLQTILLLFSHFLRELLLRLLNLIFVPKLKCLSKSNVFANSTLGQVSALTSTQQSHKTPFGTSKKKQVVSIETKKVIYASLLLRIDKNRDFSRNRPQR